MQAGPVYYSYFFVGPLYHNSNKTNFIEDWFLVNVGSKVDFKNWLNCTHVQDFPDDVKKEE